MSGAAPTARSKYPILPWRGLYDIMTCWIVIGAAIWLVKGVSWWFYPISAILIANRVLALSLLCHEGLHGTLFKNRYWNDFFGRYFCAFPTGISFSKYRRLHLLHHSSIGSKKWDPDLHLYSPYPQSFQNYLFRTLWRVLTFQTLHEFLLYYTDFPELIKILREKGRGIAQSLSALAKGDFFEFILFHSFVVWGFYQLGILADYGLFYILPILCLTQPYVLLMGGLQHGPIKEGRQGGASRTVVGAKFYMWLLLPLDINFHAEHHLNASVPHYWLKDFSRDLQGENTLLWHESYLQSLRALFFR